MNEPDKELSAELKLKLMQVEKDAAQSSIPREKVLKSSLLGMTALAIIPFFGILQFPAWKIITASIIFGIAGAFLFGMAAVCRSNKK